VQEVRRTAFPDREQLSFALEEKRVMVTMDSDFLILASQAVPHAGIAYANPNRSIGELIGAIILLYDLLTPAEMINHVEYL
jgi:hypothetical protein